MVFDASLRHRGHFSRRHESANNLSYALACQLPRKLLDEPGSNIYNGSFAIACVSFTDNHTSESISKLGRKSGNRTLGPGRYYGNDGYDPGAVYRPGWKPDLVLRHRRKARLFPIHIQVAVQQPPALHYRQRPYLWQHLARDQSRRKHSS